MLIVILELTTYNEASFEREFESRWSGTTEDAYFNPEIFARNRVLNQPEYEASGRSSKLATYVISVDVARFKGCDTVFCIFKSSFIFLLFSGLSFTCDFNSK